MLAKRLENPIQDGVARGALIMMELLMGISAIGGGIALLTGAMDAWIPAAWLAGSPFATLRVPAMALIVLVGASNLVAALLLIARHKYGAIASVVAGTCLIGFEIVETATIGLRMWLQPFCFAIGVAILLLALLPHSAATGAS